LWDLIAAAKKDGPTQQPGSGTQSQRNSASGQPTGATQQGMIFTNDTIDKIQSPRDPASGQATGYLEGGVNDTTYQGSAGTETANTGQFMSGAGGDGQGIRRNQPQPGSALRTETVGANETVNASPGTSDKWIGGTDDGSSIRQKKPRRDRNRTRGKRMHKP
jgi:hypothetical protein